MKDIAISSKAIPANPRSKNYPAGGGVTYTGGGSSTVVSPGGGVDSGLSKDIIVNSPKVGHVETGDTLKKGLTYEQLFRAILCKSEPASLQSGLSTANDVEYGSVKGVITYTATRNSSGLMKKAFFDNDENNTFAFTGNANGVQTAVRQLTGVYTLAESYFATVVYAASDNGEIPEKTLTNKISVNVRRKWFAGVCDTIPTTSAQVRALSGNGLYTGAGSYRFTISGYKTFVICIPSDSIKEVTMERYVYNFMDLDSAALPKKILVEGVNGSQAIEYTMYEFSSKTTSSETDNFTFKSV